MLADIFLQSKEFQKLIFKGRDQQFLTPEEINDAIPASIVNPDDIDKILMKVFEMRIEVQAAGTEEVVAEEGIRLDGAEIIEETLSR
ncbi:MAG: RNA polymerase sigma factor region1.1 domain-containing protein, partial [Bdellovibrionota bacterium]